MLKVTACLTEKHELGLVALAALVCLLAAVACIELARHARRAATHAHPGWLVVAATAGGSGIWATHFIAMLAFEPGLPNGYDVSLTILSFVLAILLTGVSLWIALTRRPAAPWFGGAMLGTGIAAMHYTGMAAFEVGGRLQWDPGLVAASLLLGGALAALSLRVGLAGARLRHRLGGALLLLLAICSHHFTAMGAVSILADPTVTVPDGTLPSRWLALGVALASLAILLMAGTALILDLRDRRHAAQHPDRLRSLANAAVEGLIVVHGDTIVNANENFASLAGIAATDLPGTGLSSLLPGAMNALAAGTRADQGYETELRTANGEAIPVEVLMRPLIYGDRPHSALAVRDLRARREAESRIRFLAHHDHLTGLANRARFNERFEQDLKTAEATGRKLAVFCLDLDRFKEVNDLFGHATGDALLIRVAQRVGDLLDGDQLMGRLGGDEFAVLMPCDHAVAAGRLAERILEALHGRAGDGTDPAIAASVGIALYPDDATERTTLLGCADTALYKAKSDGRGTYRFFEAEMGIQVREKRLIEHDLRHALAKREMHLVYQPQAHVKTGRIFGFEVLIRWHHPTRGMVAPSHFIPIAEESGLIHEIGEWVLRTACREAAGWPNPLAVAVNVSAAQLHAPRFVQIVHEALLDTGLRPDRLEIEITETALIRDPGRAQASLRLLKSLGVRIAMDDFGTGYSSLSNLRTYPFDKIKIDASLIKSVDESEPMRAIVRSVLGLGRGLGLPVLAEGVETSAELRFLAAEECDAVQGYFLGRPSAIADQARLTHGDGIVPAAGCDPCDAGERVLSLAAKR